MQVLLIKMSSMGDVIHTLPALTDALQAIPGLEIDWVVEPAFADIPAWHPAVKNTILMPLRRWRKNIFSRTTFCEIKAFYKQLRKKKYDVIIDAQGLLKSAIVATIARGTTAGLDKNSAREGLSSYFYRKKYAVKKNQHAITRTRQLFSQLFNYSLQDKKINYGVNFNKLPTPSILPEKKYVVFLHGTTWKSKHYPDSYWKTLLEKCDKNNIPVYLPWGNNTEEKRAEKLASGIASAIVLPKLSISQIASVLKNAAAVVAVDTGFGHLCAALGTPTISLYGPTNANEIGAIGDNQIHLQANFPCSPCKSRDCLYAKTHQTDIITPACFTTINPDKVWEALNEIARII